MNFPKNLLYSKDYLWALKKEDLVIIGVIELAAKKAKEFAYINFPKKGDNVNKGDTLISLEAVKWTGTLKSPISGEVIEINSKAYGEPSIVNSKPYETWLVKLKIKNLEEFKDLMNSQKALKYYEND
ncbi:MAG: glycine cleavage system protein H [Candidatus Nanoarchaeia archaeon]|jgi:glycine cleavage system H protein